MTSFQPQSWSPEQLKTLYPPNLELRQVQVIFRHGIAPRASSSPPIPLDD